MLCSEPPFTRKGDPVLAEEILERRRLVLGTKRSDSKRISEQPKDRELRRGLFFLVGAGGFCDQSS